MWKTWLEFRVAWETGGSGRCFLLSYIHITQYKVASDQFGSPFRWLPAPLQHSQHEETDEDEALDANGSRSYVWSTRAPTQAITTGTTQPPDDLVDLSGESLPARTSHTIISPARVSSFVSRDSLSSLFHDVRHGARSRDRSSQPADSANRRARSALSLSHDTENRALRQQFLVILVTARPYSPSTWKQSDKGM